MNIFGFSLGGSGWAGGAAFFFFSSESVMVAVGDLHGVQGGMAEDLGTRLISNAGEKVAFDTSEDSLIPVEPGTRTKNSRETQRNKSTAPSRGSASSPVRKQHG